MAGSSGSRLARYLCFLAIGISLPLGVLATPAWNTVNGVYPNGTSCPLPTYHAYTCAPLCVRDIASCPESIRPTCPEGQTYCVDGSCRSSCPSDLQSKCSCPGAPVITVPIYACEEGSRADIHNFVASNKSAQRAEACAIEIGVPTSVSAWDGANPPDMMWGECPTPDYGPLNFHEPAFIALYVFYGSCVAMFILWTLYKRLREKVNMVALSKKARRNDGLNEKIDDKDSDSSVVANKKSDGVKNKDTASDTSGEHNDGMVIKAYKRDYIGMFCFVLYILQTLGMVAYMIMIVNDYYDDYILFRGFQVVQSSTFIGMWYIFFFWFACLAIFKNRLMNFFRIRCSYTEADYVQIEKHQDPIIFSQDQSDRLMDTVRWAENLISHAIGLDVVVTTSQMKSTNTGVRYFVYQCTRYVYDPHSETFNPHDFDLGDTNASLAALNGGLSTEEASRREELIGLNFINVYVPNIPMAVLREFSAFFYIYQFSVLWIFYYFAFWTVGVSDTAVILLSAVINVFVKLRSERRIKKMAEFTDNVNILRDGQWKEMSTADLVPGDVFEVAENKTTPCDAVILSGNIVVDESSLTGEPLPIRKFPIRSDDDSFYSRVGSGKIHTIFCGTTISQAQPTFDGEKVTALATNTGTGTDKGQLVKKILFPAPVSFIFNEQIKITIIILLCYGLIALGLAIWLYATGTSAWMYSMLAIAQLLSPLLPAALVVGQSVASGRLRDKKIYCVDLPRILMAGKVQLFCFDKTGTLTKEGLEFFGAQPINDFDKKPEKPQFGEKLDNVADVPRLLQIGLATCHAVTTLNGQFIGNPVDIEMFRSSGWTLEDKKGIEDAVDTLTPPSTSNIKEPIHVLKRFEFVHARMSMSVAILDTLTNKVHIFVKGAYEKIKDLCEPDSIPADYDSMTSNLARQGCYVLSLAHREIDLEEIGGMKAFRNWTRDQMEEQIRFAGLIIFKNQLKEDTTENIAELKSGDTRTIMITGDTALTGVFIARQCGMALPNSRILLGDLDKKTNRVVWTDVDEPETFPDVNPDEYLHNKEHTPVELAVTGKAFQWLVDNDLIRKYLLDIRVFARMTPTGKVLCVQLHMERGITAMTGDGGNDCGALRTAHVGIAMSDAEASIVSPFSTSIRSVKSCVELIRQGRAALTTSLTGYKYLILYGQVMVMMKIITFYFSITMSQYVWIAIDVFITVFLSWAVSQSKAADRLEPCRPTARLLGPQTLASCLGLVSINWIYMSCAFYMLYKQEWFRCNEFDSNAVDISKWWLLADNYEAEVLTVVGMFMFINNAAVFSFGYKFRRPIYRNYPLIFLWALYIAIVSYWTLADPNRFGCLFRLNCGTPQVLQELGYPVPPTYIEDYNLPLGHNIMPWDFRWRLWGLCVGNMATALLYERIIVLGPVHTYLAKRFPLARLQITR
ncbi:hypothetical protein O0I10_002490 [Lichtheimia ornata]|uniref:P-type ATPase A domain-containing protein n=1 Tax=Lichtheimia ornata TaxID=688661 RepID=A0AAD7V970_9FUNG|nr:uncharacterized protein O0I10_002490 [Lichtheimia ornata]KAJ8661683.1 hypothetical protein O0I10_002490 [Lichtheimia ornata]